MAGSMRAAPATGEGPGALYTPGVGALRAAGPEFVLMPNRGQGDCLVLSLLEWQRRRTGAAGSAVTDGNVAEARRMLSRQVAVLLRAEPGMADGLKMLHSYGDVVGMAGEERTFEENYARSVRTPGFALGDLEFAVFCRHAEVNGYLWNRLVSGEWGGARVTGDVGTAEEWRQDMTACHMFHDGSFHWQHMVRGGDEDGGGWSLVRDPRHKRRSAGSEGSGSSERSERSADSAGSGGGRGQGTRVLRGNPSRVQLFVAGNATADNKRARAEKQAAGLERGASMSASSGSRSTASPASLASPGTDSSFSEGLPRERGGTRKPHREAVTPVRPSKQLARSLAGSSATPLTGRRSAPGQGERRSSITRGRGSERSRRNTPVEAASARGRSGVRRQGGGRPVAARALFVPPLMPEHREGETKQEFLDSCIEMEVAGFKLFEHPGFRIKCGQQRAAVWQHWDALLGEVVAAMTATSDAQANDPEVRRAWALFNLLPRLVLWEPPRKGRQWKWKTYRRIQNMRTGEYLREMLDFSLLACPLNRSQTPKRASDQDAELEALGAMLSDADPSMSALTQLLGSKAKIPSGAGVEPAARRLMRLGMIGRAARRAEDGNKVVAFNAEAVSKMEELHPAALHMQHDGDGPLPEGAIILEIGLEALFTAAKSSARGSAAGPDGHEMDILTRVFRGLDAEAYLNADASVAANQPKHALIVALHGLVNAIARGWVPKTALRGLFSATGFALEKPDGSMRPIACGVALRRLVARCMMVASAARLREVLAADQFAVGYPGGAEACKLGLEQTLEEDESLAFGWIDYRAAFNSTCRSLISDAVELFIPEWMSFYRRSYGIVSNVVFFKDTASGTQVPHQQPSREGVQQGDPLGPALFSLAQKVLQMLVRRALGGVIDLVLECVDERARTANTWDTICARFDGLQSATADLGVARANMLAFKALDTDEAAPDGSPPSPTDEGSSWAICVLKAFMDDQYSPARPGAFAFFFLINRIVAKHFGGLEVNVNQVKGKSGLFIRGHYHRLEELRLLFPGVIISATTPAQDRGVKVLGSYLIQSDPEYITKKLHDHVDSAFTTAGIGIARLQDRQLKYHLLHKSFVHKFTHLFRTLPPSLTEQLAVRLDSLNVDILKLCLGLNHEPSTEWLSTVLSSQICSPLKLGGMGLPSNAALRYTAYLGCWASLLLEGGTRWARSFPKLAHYGVVNSLVGRDRLSEEGRGGVHLDLERNNRLVSEWSTCVDYLRADGPGAAGPGVGEKQLETSALERLLAAEGAVSFQTLRRNDRDRSVSQSGLSRFAAERWVRATKTELLRTADDPSAGPLTQSQAIRRHQSITTASAPGAWLTLSSLPKDHNSTLDNFAFTTDVEIRLFLPLALSKSGVYKSGRCNHCKITLENGSQIGQPLQHGYHLITGCKHVNQGKAAHRNIEGTIKAYFTKFSSASARTVTKNLRGTNRKPDVLLSNLNGTDNKDVYLDVSTTNPYGKTNQTNSHRRGSQPSDNLVPCESHLTSAATRETQKISKYRLLCAQLPVPSIFYPFVLETTGGFGNSTKATVALLAQNVRDSSDIDPKIVISMFKRDIAFALRRGTALQLRVVNDAALDAIERDRLLLADGHREL